MATTNIEWAEKVWNPLTGCSRVSAGCENCYAEKMAFRLMQMGVEKYAGTVKKTAAGKTQWTGKINLDEASLSIPSKTKKPTIFFVNSMSDLFHESVHFRFIDKVFREMRSNDQHTFLILTKRPERMVELIKNVWMPLKNVWLGVSVEDQAAADQRRPYLKVLSKFGWNTWVSNEPCLSYIDWKGWDFIKWMVTGGESGPKARPMHPYWAEQTMMWCQGYKISFFFKQFGEWMPIEMPALQNSIFSLKPNEIWLNDAGKSEGFNGSNIYRMRKVGKKKSGNELLGKQYLQYPAEMKK